MKKLYLTRIIIFPLFLLSIILLTTPLILAEENLYLKESLNLKLDVNGTIFLTKETNNAQLNTLTANLLLYPKEDFRQEIINIDTNGKIDENDKQIIFFWDDGIINDKSFGYSSLIKTKNIRNKVKEKINFPLNPETFNDYLQPTENIDSENHAIIAKASELAEGETDLFKVVFNLANWVEENIIYDLNTLTASTSQKASWVLENKEGVCDEITTLFVAMCRSLGIPARFVSGISYTTSELFDENWQPHGWAEVYFPEIGWVGFDITFGEYGYLDVTHIKLKESSDPAEPATLFNWVSNDVSLEAKALQISVIVTEKGQIIPPKISLALEVFPSVDIGSYNLVKATLKSEVDYYSATTLKLAKPEEIQIIGKDKRKILLSPYETKETFWIIKVSETLDSRYWYRFPILVYDEKNDSILSEFSSQQGEKFYSKEEIEALVVNTEEKTYSQQIDFKCLFQEEIKLEENNLISCKIKNRGNTNLNAIDFCLDNQCKVINLPINQEYSLNKTIFGEIAGWKKIIISAKNEMIDKKASIDFKILDQPSVLVEINSPEKVYYGTDFEINLDISKQSFSFPQNVTVSMKKGSVENIWNLNELKTTQKINLGVDGESISSKNIFKFLISWTDQEKNEFSEEKIVIIGGIGSNFNEKFKMLLNMIIGLF